MGHWFPSIRSGTSDNIPKSACSTQRILHLLATSLSWHTGESCGEQRENWPLPHGTEYSLLFLTSCFTCWLCLGRSMAKPTRDYKAWCKNKIKSLQCLAPQSLTKFGVHGAPTGKSPVDEQGRPWGRAESRKRAWCPHLLTVLRSPLCASVTALSE